MRDLVVISGKGGTGKTSIVASFAALADKCVLAYAEADQYKRWRTEMPIFEYRCKQCGHVTSFLEKAGRVKSHVCEKCGSKATEKLLSTFAANTKPDSGSGNASCPTGTCPLT